MKRQNTWAALPDWGAVGAALPAGGVAGTALVLSAVALLSLPARAKTS